MVGCGRVANPCGNEGAMGGKGRGGGERTRLAERYGRGWWLILPGETGSGPEGGGESEWVEARAGAGVDWVESGTG